MPEADKPDLTMLTVQLLSAYVSNNAVLERRGLTVLSGVVVAPQPGLPD